MFLQGQFSKVKAAKNAKTGESVAIKVTAGCLENQFVSMRP